MFKRRPQPSGVTAEQAHVAARCRVKPWPVELEMKMGVARNVFEQRLLPINGLRHPPERGTNGWYLWAVQ